jgi:predicted polyphosphate/ATP-dependent NAD kinase
MAKWRLGLIVNPIAGLGGAVGLKGTDTAEIVAHARSLGAVPHAPERARMALSKIAAAVPDELRLLTAAGEMGETPAREAGFDPEVVGPAPRRETSAEDTEQAASLLLELGADFLLFAGGDGTARDICHAVGGQLPTLGIPAGVKMHSAVYATSPQAAADLVVRYLRQRVALRELEVMDIDEAAFRAGAVSAKLYGYLKVPYDPALVQGIKVGHAAGDAAALDSIAAEVAGRMEPGRLYILGPGTTVRAIARHLDIEKTLLGVDLVRDGRLVAADVTERDILRAIQDRPATIIVTPIGGQGHVLGRGNQQISAAVVDRVGADRILVVASAEKLASLHNQSLRVDTGDANLDHRLDGYARVITGFGAEAVCRLIG